VVFFVLSHDFVLALDLVLVLDLLHLAPFLLLLASYVLPPLL
jgi:hypothetical protein